MSKKILILNGPNLNLVGSREPQTYGTKDMNSIIAEATAYALQLGFDAEYFHSNCEGAIIDRLQQAGFDPAYAGIVLNAGAYTHTSLAIADAIRAITVPVVEVHLSNIAAREAIRHNSLIAPACRGSIAGFGADVYRLGIEAVAHF